LFSTIAFMVVPFAAKATLQWTETVDDEQAKRF